MIILNMKRNETGRADYAAADRKNNQSSRPSRTDLDFYTYNAIPSISWMQEGFKTEQR